MEYASGEGALAVYHEGGPAALSPLSRGWSTIWHQGRTASGPHSGGVSSARADARMDQGQVGSMEEPRRRCRDPREPFGLEGLSDLSAEDLEPYRSAHREGPWPPGRGDGAYRDPPGP